MKKSYKGRFVPTNPKKYRGDPTNIIYRSRWEFDFMQYLDTHPDVIQWASEEIAIKYLSPKTRKWQNYYPDFLIEIKKKDGKTEKLLIEIKPFKETQPPDEKRKTHMQFLRESVTYSINSSKWAAAREWCRKNNVTFKIMTEKELYGRKK
jgi:hypothetical protein